MASRGKEGWDYIIGSDWHCVSHGLDTLVLDRMRVLYLMKECLPQGVLVKALPTWVVYLGTGKLRDLTLVPG